MQAKTLNCLSCGAPVTSNAYACKHCGARVATVVCPCCFNLTFRDSRYCPSCGEVAVQWQTSLAMLPCPRCETPLLKARVGESEVYHCNKCFGFWLDRATFDHVCRRAEKLSVNASFAFKPAGQRNPALEKVRYVRCPGCRGLMNRVNFAECSGVVVDICREHGTWFDHEELQHIVHFIRDGGMDISRERKKAELALAPRRLEAGRTTRTSPDRELSFAVGRLQPDNILPELLRVAARIFKGR